MSVQKFDFYGEVDENSKLKIFNERKLSEALRQLTGKKVRLVIEKGTKRSHPQNRYLHGVVIPIVKAGLLDAGWIEARSDEWVKDFIKYHCLVKEYANEKTGEVMKSLGRTSELSTSEFMDMLADIQRWATEYLNIYIPDPGEAMELEL